jgi:branched-chain amino acid transport system ATP-binding protein
MSSAVTPLRKPAPPATALLDVSGVTMRFAGLVALDDVSVAVRPGTVHAVIGPNGAGKSTLFNVISGVYRPQAGSVTFDGAELTTRRMADVAAAGIARTFQNLALFTGLSVEENLMLGRHRLLRTGWLGSALRTPRMRREDRRHRERVREIASFLDLEAVLARPVGQLSYGERKRVELARAVCMEPRVLLVDEPVAGMDARESREMGGRVLALRDALGVAVLLIEHDMGLVMRVADEVTVLNFGRCIAHGSPDEVRRNDAVVEAYLGSGGGG